MPFVQTLRCSCEKIKGQVEKWHLVVSRRGTVGMGHASRSCVYGVAVQSVYVLQ